MDESNKKYNPKYSREPEFLDDGSWKTGSTQPPKDRGGTMALLLILIIFLCGIITVLGILNVRLFTQLQNREEVSPSISFTPEETKAIADSQTEPVPILETSPSAAAYGADSSFSLQDSPLSKENIPQDQGLSLQAIYEKNIPSVVSITCHTKNGSSTGTGVVLSRKGYIVTNAHVVEHAVSVTVRLMNGETVVETTTANGPGSTNSSTSGITTSPIQ